MTQFARPTPSAADYDSSNYRTPTSTENLSAPLWRNSCLRRLQEQGDGMRAFASILVDTFTEPRSLVMIDEPENFLHPPQVRQIATFLAKDLGRSTQVVVTCLRVARSRGRCMRSPC